MFSKFGILLTLLILTLLIIVFVVLTRAPSADRFKYRVPGCIEWTPPPGQPTVPHTAFLSQVNSLDPPAQFSIPIPIRDAVATRPVPQPYAYTLKHSQFEHLPSSVTFKIHLLATTGYESACIELPMYSHGTQSVVPIVAVLDTGSHDLVIPTTFTKNPNLMGVWDGQKNCPNYDIYEPLRDIHYGSAGVRTVPWTSPVILTEEGEHDTAATLTWFGVVEIVDQGIPYIPPLCGLLPTYASSPGFIQQMIQRLTDAQEGFTLDLRPGYEHIAIGTLLENGIKLPMMTESDYIRCGVSQRDVKPILFFTARVSNVFTNGLSCVRQIDTIPRYAILDTGTSGVVIGTNTQGEPYLQLYQCMNQNVQVEIELDYRVRLRMQNKVQDKTIDYSDPIYGSHGPTLPFLNTFLVGLPMLRGQVMSFDLKNRQTIFKI